MSASVEQLEQKIRAGEARVGTLGLGYVGLPLSVEFASAGLDALTARPLTFEVPADCPAQRLELSGSSSDIPRQVDVTIHDLALVKAGANG